MNVNVIMSIDYNYFKKGDDIMAEAEFDRALDHLRENKVRLTPQRKTILNYLINHHTHPSVEMIYDDLKDTVDNISMATVYNTLKLFVDYNLVIELKNGDGSTHFDYFGHPHYHVVCDNCGKISDVFDEHFKNNACANVKIVSPKVIPDLHQHFIKLLRSKRNTPLRFDCI